MFDFSAGGFLRLLSPSPRAVGCFSTRSKKVILIISREYVTGLIRRIGGFHTRLDFIDDKSFTVSRFVAIELLPGLLCYPAFAYLTGKHGNDASTGPKTGQPHDRNVSKTLGNPCRGFCDISDPLKIIRRFHFRCRPAGTLPGLATPISLCGRSINRPGRKGVRVP